MAKTQRQPKTPLLKWLKNSISKALESTNPQESNFPQNLPPISRRQFLVGSSIFAAGIAIGPIPFLPKNKRHPKIVIVGAGIAGLYSAHILKKSGISATIYEASSRTGGRMFSVEGAMAPGLVTEFGGEFIDSTHSDILSLAQELGLLTADRHISDESKYAQRGFFFGGRHYTEQEVVTAFRPIAPKIASDAAILDKEITFDNPANAQSLDHTSLGAYIDSLGAEKWLADLLKVAYLTELGLEVEEQSCLNFLDLISTDVSQNKFEVFGDSDERYKIVGGNESITKKLSQKHKSQILINHKLTSITSSGTKYALTFESPSGSKKVEADMVLMTIPFSVLRNVEMKVDLPDWKRKAINELGYGTNSKLMLSFGKRVWREQGFIGETFSDERYQLTWDNAQLQKGEASGLTVFNGGKFGVEAGNGTVAEQADLAMIGLEKTYPGLSAVRTHNDKRMHWSSYPFSLGSYAAYKTGQWTTIRGAEIKPVGNLYFAGEHCSLEFQGYMNGGAETGRRAAEEILKSLQ